MAEPASLESAADDRRLQCDDEGGSKAGNLKPYLTSIRVYPIKSLDPLVLPEATVADEAGIAGDREFALFDAHGTVLHAKRLGKRIMSIRARYQRDGRSVELRVGDSCERFDLEDDREAVEAWFSLQLQCPVSLRRNGRTGFVDDSDALGPTLVGSASLASVADWFDLETEELRRRLRTNLEIAGLEPFEEDSLFGPPGQPRRFRIGAVELMGTNPCSRCIVPSIDSLGGSAPDKGFAARFAARREQERWQGSELDRYGHYYRLAINTRLAPGQGGKTLRVGDELSS